MAGKWIFARYVYVVTCPTALPARFPAPRFTPRNLHFHLRHHPVFVNAPNYLLFGDEDSIKNMVNAGGLRISEGAKVDQKTQRGEFPNGVWYLDNPRTKPAFPKVEHWVMRSDTTLENVGRRARQNNAQPVVNAITVLQYLDRITTHLSGLYTFQSKEQHTAQPVVNWATITGQYICCTQFGSII